ncbi:MAG: citramalate synthase [Magnetococcales bacterium]|nr:citramalate synthase [Magnetococcales bacterium]
MTQSAHPITLYDTTLRDGSQGEDILFSVEDKLRIAQKLDGLGVDFIEGGWPGANPKDEAFFQKARGLTLNKSRLVAFGSTRRAGVKAEADVVLAGLLRAQTQAITIFGKSWDLHATRALGISLEENLELIFDSIAFLKSRVETVFFDAEHFFDGYKANAPYALKVLDSAREAGADALILCDTNGGSMVSEVAEITALAVARGGSIGIHCHNDTALAVANTLAAVEAGALHVQGTINGIGERCGNADLTAVIANLAIKMKRPTTLTGDQVGQLKAVSGFLNEISNRQPRKNQPFVGLSAFAHKGGIHVSAVLKDPITYEHIDPESVGNQRRILVSEQAGRSNLFYKLQEFGLQEVSAKDPRVKKLLEEIKTLEHRGYQFDGAEASFEIRARRALGEMPDYFSLKGFRVIDERRVRDDGERWFGAEAAVKVEVAGKQVHLIDEGAGPVDALHGALSKALERTYPTINDMELVDYKVRILNGGGTGATVRVQIEWRDQNRIWGTVGVSDHIIAASYDAMVEAVIYKLFKDGASPAQSLSQVDHG